MDYLVFGVGFGSTLVLVGWVLRQFGPAFRYRNEPDDVLSAEQILERNDWQRFCIAMGALLSVCGAVILLVTLITLLIRPSDRVGTFVVGGLFVLALIAVAAWVVMYVNQHRALAGDRRAEVVAAKATRKPAKPRPAIADPAAGATAGSRPTPAAAASEDVTPSAEGLDALDRRRRAAQQQRRPAGGASAASDAAARTTTRPAQPSPASSDLARAEHEATDATSTSAFPAAPAIADPAQALRNVQFKRAGSSRVRDEGAAPATTTTTPAPVRPASSPAVAPEGDDSAGMEESHPASSRDDA